MKYVSCFIDLFLFSGKNRGMDGKQTREPTQERGIETRNRFIEAGISLFIEKGYYYTNTKEIARRAGAAVGSFYAYFEDKMDLFLAVIDHYNELILSGIQDDLRQLEIFSSEPKVLLRKIVETTIKAHAVYPKLHNEIDLLEMKEPKVREKKSGVRDKSLELLYQIIKVFDTQITHPDPEQAAYLVYRLVEDGAHVANDPEEGIDPEVLVSEITLMIYRYLFL